MNPETPEPDRFRLLLKECKRLGVKNAWIVAPMKGTYDGYIAQAIGAEQARNSSNTKSVTSDDVTIHGHHATRLPSLGRRMPHPRCLFGSESLEAGDALFSVPSLVVVPNATIASNLDTQE